MDAIKHDLQERLEETIERLKGLGGAVAFEDYPGALEDDGQGDAGSDGASIGEERALAVEVRGRLVERGNRRPGARGRLPFGDEGAGPQLRELPPAGAPAGGTAGTAHG